MYLEIYHSVIKFKLSKRKYAVYTSEYHQKRDGNTIIFVRDI
jgi:hypothetical protein